MALAESINILPLLSAPKRAKDEYENSKGIVKAIMASLKTKRLLNSTTDEQLLTILVGDRPVTPDAKDALLIMIASERASQMMRMADLAIELPQETARLRNRLRALTTHRTSPELYIHKDGDHTALIRGLEGNDGNQLRMSDVKVLPIVLGNRDQALRVIGNIERVITNGNTRPWPNVWDIKTESWAVGPLKLRMPQKGVTLNINTGNVRVDGLWRREALISDRMMPSSLGRQGGLGYRLLSTLFNLIRSAQYGEPNSVMHEGLRGPDPLDARITSLNIPPELHAAYGSTASFSLVSTYDYDSDNGTVTRNPERYHIFPKILNIPKLHMKKILQHEQGTNYWTKEIQKATVVPPYELGSRFSARLVSL